VFRDSIQLMPFINHRTAIFLASFGALMLWGYVFTIRTYFSSFNIVSLIVLFQISRKVSVT